MIDPKFMDETLGIDRSKLAERYKQINEEQEPAVKETPIEEQRVTFAPPSPAPTPRRQLPPLTPDPSMEGDEFYDREQMEEQVKPEYRTVTQPQAETPPPRQTRRDRAPEQDRELWPNGPLVSEVLAWKKQYGKIYRTEFEGQIFIWRTINRFEYKQLMSVPNTNELMREEMICESCVLFPYEYTYESMANEPGGIPSLLAEQIMQKSGFTRKVRVVAL
jgi:hypothetical protein